MKKIILNIAAYFAKYGEQMSNWNTVC